MKAMKKIALDVQRLTPSNVSAQKFICGLKIHTMSFQEGRLEGYVLERSFENRKGVRG